MTTLDEAFQLALQHHQAGRLQEAEGIYRQLLKQLPDNPDVLHYLGVLAHQVGKQQEALELIDKAIQINPDNIFYHINLGLALNAFGKWQKAKDEFREVLRIEPDCFEAFINLGSIAKNQNDYVAAAEYYQQALRLKPDSVETHCNLGNVLREQYLFDDARHHYQLALQLKDDFAEAHNNFGLLLQNEGKYEEALQHYQQAVKIKPDYKNAHSNLLFLLSYHVLRSPEETLAAHREWDHVNAVPVSERYSHSHQGDPEKRLRIGYVSPDLRRHSVSFFFEPLLTGHDHGQVEIYCYAEVTQQDEVTARLQSLSDGWYSTVGMSDAQIAEKIHQDGIDILVDLAGHNASNRLRVFTYKPAPIQATYLGYFTTTGLATMDYWITDDVLTPAKSVEQTTETIYRLPRCCLSYTPPEEAPDVSARPAQGDVVFGSFNDLAKVSPDAIGLWSKVLKVVPGSSLLIKARQLADRGVQEWLVGQFSNHGIAPERLMMMPQTRTLKAHLDVYGEIDIALDTVPRTGGTTTMEALWMGVPVITLAGERFIERLSASMLTAVGLTECIVTSEVNYIEKAKALAGSVDKRMTLRNELRDRVKTSPLCDSPDLAKAMETAYRDMWQTHLALETIGKTL